MWEAFSEQAPESLPGRVLVSLVLRAGVFKGSFSAIATIRLKQVTDPKSALKYGDEQPSDNLTAGWKNTNPHSPYTDYKLGSDSIWFCCGSEVSFPVLF